MLNIKRRLKHHFKEVAQVKRSPHSIALGFAVGTLISILPTPGFNILLGLLVVLIYSRINKFSLFGSMAFWNPLTLFPIYLASYKIGDLLFSSAPVIKYDVVILDHIYNYSRRYLVGNAILAVSIAFVSYVLVWLIATSVRKRRRKTRRKD
jgi:uncharacterized protein (DUF2062 family)